MGLKARKSANVIPVGCPAHNMSTVGGGGCPVMKEGDEKRFKTMMEQKQMEEEVADSMSTIYSILIFKVFVIALVFVILWFMEGMSEAPLGSPANPHPNMLGEMAGAASAGGSGIQMGSMGEGAHL